MKSLSFLIYKVKCYYLPFTDARPHVHVVTDTVSLIDYS